ncbi:MAG: hypothetical protein AAGB22_15935, partial [Bacteroidota bacterium]
RFFLAMFLASHNELHQIPQPAISPMTMFGSHVLHAAATLRQAECPGEMKSRNAHFAVSARNYG